MLSFQLLFGLHRFENVSVGTIETLFRLFMTRERNEVRFLSVRLWYRLYDLMISRHSFLGPSRFSDEAEVFGIRFGGISI